MGISKKKRRNSTAGKAICMIGFMLVLVGTCTENIAVIAVTYAVGSMLMLGGGNL